jgi:hypothetical protein
MNSYLKLKEQQQKEVNDFPMVFAFSKEQFEKAMQKLGLTVKDTDKIYSIGGGGYIRKTDSEAFGNMFKKHKKEMDSAIAEDLTGDGFIYEMFNYELSNHEYVITGDTEDTINALGLTIEEIQQDKRLLHALKKACKYQEEWYRKHG